jgi:hypothetical protein
MNNKIHKHPSIYGTIKKIFNGKGKNETLIKYRQFLFCCMELKLVFLKKRDGSRIKSTEMNFLNVKGHIHFIFLFTTV